MSYVIPATRTRAAGMTFNECEQTLHLAAQQ